MTRGYDLLARATELVAHVASIAADLKRRNELLEANNLRLDRQHDESLRQYADLRDDRMIEYVKDYLDAFEDSLTTRHLDELADTFRSFRARTGDDDSIEQRTLLAGLYEREARRAKREGGAQ